MFGSEPSTVAPDQPIRLPQFGFGCAPLGNLFLTIPETVAQDTLVAAWESGVRYFDTAPWYGHGLSEHRLGVFLRQKPRGEVFVSTKVGRVYEPAGRGADERIQWKGGLNFRVTYDYSARGFQRSLEQSRMRLATSSIDALVIHDLDRGYHGSAFGAHLADLQGSGLCFLRELKRTGEIAAIGMGINSLHDFETMADTVEVDFFLVAMPYTLLDQSSLKGPMARCLERGIGVIIGAPFASGILAAPRNPDAQYGYAPASAELKAKALAMAKCCEDHGVPLAAAALQFPLLHPAVRSVIPGAVSPEQARANYVHANLPIPCRLWEELKAKRLIDPDAPTR